MPVKEVYQNHAEAYRSAITAADVIPAAGAAMPTVTLSDINAVGVFANVAHYVKIVATNAYGRTTATAVQTITPTANHQIKAAFAAVTGATNYDVYCSIDADPKWVGRITEAQRASGILIDAVGSTAAGGAVNSVYILLVGTGLQAANTAAQNTAYSIPATFDCAGHQYCDFDLVMTVTQDVVSPALVVIPFFYDSVAGTYFAGASQTISFGGGGGAYLPMSQRLRVEVRGNQAVALVVASIAGTGASLTITRALS